MKPLRFDSCVGHLVLVPLIEKISKLWHWYIMTCRQHRAFAHKKVQIKTQTIGV